MASLRRPKLCWAPGIKPVACCPSDSLCRHYCTLPLGAPAGAGRGRAGGETETWFREKAAGGGGVRGKSQSKERLACQRCSVPGDPVTHWTPKRWSRCSQKAGREGARARTGTGEPRGRTGSGRRGGLRAGAGAPSGERLQRAAGRTRGLLARGPRDEAANRGGSRHRPWAGDGSAPRGRGKGDRQAGICVGPLPTTALLQGGQQRGRRAHRRERQARLKRETMPGMTATSGVEGVDKADFMGELVKEEVELQEVMQMENVEKHLAKKLHWTVIVCILKRNKKAEDWNFLSNALKTLGYVNRAFLVAQLVKNLPSMQETPVRFLGREDPLAKG